MTKQRRDTSLALFFSLASCLPVAAHETDQFSVPSGRAYADLRLEFSRELYDVLENAISTVNRRIEWTLKDGNPTESTGRYQSQEHLAGTVWATFPLRVMYVEFVEAWLRTPEVRRRYPGLLTIYAPPTWIYDHWALVIDPTKLPRNVRCSTITVNGVQFGTDKLMHFIHLGYFYYQVYARMRANGHDEAEAMRQAAKLGTGSHPIYSEEMWLGLLSTGVRSNADLAVNYIGLKFFRNLTEPMSFKGQTRPPLLVRDGQIWRLNDHVRRDRDFFSVYVSDHWDEALLPNTYAPGIGVCVCEGIEKRCPALLAWYRDDHGRQGMQADFRAITATLSTYFGEDYGFKGDFDELDSVAGCCFNTDATPASTASSNATESGLLGRTELWWAARQGDAARVKTLIADGAALSVADVDGETPLHAAVRGGRIDVVHPLLERGAPVDAASRLGARPLHLAIRLDFEELAFKLIEAGADPNAADAFGCTPLHDARDRRAEKVIRRLLEAGGNPDLTNNFGRPALPEGDRFRRDVAPRQVGGDR